MSGKFNISGSNMLKDSFKTVGLSPPHHHEKPRIWNTERRRNIRFNLSGHDVVDRPRSFSVGLFAVQALKHYVAYITLNLEIK
jgi:hypothetical protein